MRPLTIEDIPAAMRLKAAAGWNQTSEDWRRFLHLEPEGCFSIDVDGTLAATACAIRYGTALSWIGMVLTLPEFRGRGYAAMLMQECIAWLERSGVEWIKLDATAQGRPIYARMGFEDESAVERWYRAPVITAGSAAVDQFELDAALDLAAFGADRRRLLDALAPLGAASIGGQGYVMARPGSEAYYLGPCLSRGPAAVESMIGWAVAQAGDRPVYWDLLPWNSQAAQLAVKLGFEKRRELVRMARPGVGRTEPVRADSSLVYAIAGFEYG